MVVVLIAGDDPTDSNKFVVLNHLQLTERTRITTLRTAAFEFSWWSVAELNDDGSVAALLYAEGLGKRITWSFGLVKDG